VANEKRMDQVILGLLSHESLTGYEIKKRIDTTLKYFWGGSYGSIYPTLGMLEKNGMVSKEEETETKNSRNKIRYTITEKGKAHLKEWLDTPVVKDELRYETMLKLFFGNEAGSDVAISHIQRFEDQIKGELPKLQRSVKILESLQEEETHKYYMLTAMFGARVYETYLEWCEEAKNILGTKRKEE